MRTREQCKGTSFDRLVGLCPQCGEMVMFSDGVMRVIEGQVFDFHRRCFDKVKLN